MHFVNSEASHLPELLSWFPNQHALYLWGGPLLKGPEAQGFSQDKCMSLGDFTQAIQAPHIQSFSLLDDQEQLIAFGQHYVRLQRHHLGRLAVNPKCRGRGLGKLLVAKLVAKARTQDDKLGASLFVFESNLAAYHCYLSLGFKVVPYPDKMPQGMPDCLYMVLDFN